MRKRVRREYVEAESMAEERRHCGEQLQLLSREYAAFNHGKSLFNSFYSNLIKYQSCNKHIFTFYPYNHKS